MKITVVGSSNTDMIIQVPRIPRPGETILGGSFSIAPGGKGANQAVAAARAGGDVTFIAKVGNDMFGTQAIQGFKEDGIHVQHIGIDDESSSGVALIFVGDDGENSIGVASGANANLTPANVESASDIIKDCDVLIMQLETPLETVQKAAEIASMNNVPVILNPAPAQPLSDELLGRISILTPNESEAELLTGIIVTDEQSARDAACKLRDRGVNTVIVTMGAAGAYVQSDKVDGLVPSFQVDPVDTTAAGDVFNGSLAVALTEKSSLEEAVQFANAAAALSVTKLGAQPSAPHRVDIDNF
ncbi:ribokinase, partial [candidate division KSB1 bacterium]|nr:ribokinase [candidate division KSB1 bacterium]